MKEQYVVRIGVGEEKSEKFLWLQNHGYKNIQGLTAENYNFPIIVVEGREFFGTNVTCMAASAMRGRKAISWDDWLKIVN